MLIVEDIQINRMMLSEQFSDEFEILEAENGQQAMEFIEQYGLDLSIVLLDLIMPVMDGFEVLERMNKSGIIDLLPVIMITGEDDDEKMLTGYTLGVSDLVIKPFVPDIVHRRVHNIVDLSEHRRYLERKLQEQKEMLEAQFERLKKLNQRIINSIANYIDKPCIIITEFTTVATVSVHAI